MVFWKKVLQSYPDLHLNLAHFGRFDKSISCKGKNSSLANTWEWEIGRILSSASGKNIYADLSYFNILLGDNWDNDLETARVANGLRKWINEFDPACSHLLFGTDWSMIALEGGYHSYIDNLVLFLLDDVGLNRDQVGNIFFNNAVQYFGLAHGEKTRVRLDRFYRASKKLKPGYLRKFDHPISWG